jgi:hypothetical protein
MNIMSTELAAGVYEELSVDFLVVAQALPEKPLGLPRTLQVLRIHPQPNARDLLGHLEEDPSPAVSIDLLDRLDQLLAKDVRLTLPHFQSIIITQHNWVVQAVQR